MKKILLVLIFCSPILPGYSQIAGDWVILAHTDLIKSDNDGYFEKFQSSAEVNYFISRQFTATSGVEYWTLNRQPSFVIGGRWYPIDDAFVRVRGLLGANDIGIGGGWSKPLNDSWKFEAMGDIYIKGYIAIRAGFGYVIGRK